MTISESAEYAVTRYFEQYRKCRKLEAEIYGESGLHKPSKRPVRSGKAFVLSELYNLPLNLSNPALIFRSCKSGEVDALPFSRFDGVFGFIQNLMKNVCENVS
ncbi:MAG: hypothetical protein LBC38_02365, partial [Oscillospiraceae bacterium]|nr:hypothetical protein [Oscillospiraceae bacterium]